MERMKTYFCGSRPPVTPTAPRCQSDLVASPGASSDGNSRYPMDIKALLPDSSPDLMSIDTTSDHGQLPPAGKLPINQFSSRKRHNDSAAGMHTPTSTSRHQTKRRDQAQRPHDRLQRYKYELREPKTTSKRMSEENMCLREENADLRRQVQNAEQTKILTPLENLYKSMEKQDAPNEDIILNLNEAREHNKPLRDRICKMESDKDELILQYAHAEEVRRQNCILRDDIQKLQDELQRSRTEKAKWSFQALIYQYVCKEWKDHCEQIEENHIVPWAKNKNIVYHPGTRGNTTQILGWIVRDALEVDFLRFHSQSANQQVQALQKQLVSGVEKVDIAPDELIVQQFQNLAGSIKTFSRSAIQWSKANNILAIRGIISATLTENVDPAYWTTSIRKKGLMETFIWSVLYHYLFESPFLVLGEKYKELSAIFFEMFGTEFQHDWPKPSESAERWRRVTMEHLIDSTGKEFTTEHRDAHVITSVEQLRSHIYHSIEGPLCCLDPEVNMSKVIPIVDKAIHLAQQMFLQQCRFQVVFPSPGDDYCAGATPGMSCVPENENLSAGVVRFIVRPGLAKWGDAHGKSLDERLDLVPSLVFVEPRIKREQG